MELKETADKFLTLLGCKTFSELPERIMRAVMDGEIKAYEEYLKLCPDLTVDWMQRIYQFYLADREEKKQDFTPVSLAKLLAKLTAHKGEKIVYDCCAGSGSLTIQKWNTNHDLKFICEELDGNVVPLLLFNLSVRNIYAVVVNGNVLSEEVSAVYQVQPGNRYGSVSEIAKPEIKADSGISNPPYNIKWNHPELGELDPRFTESGLPPESSANYAFVLHVLSMLNKKGRAAMILPCGVLSSGPEQQIREYLIHSGKLESVITLPDRMFESTSIPVCIMTLTQDKNEKVELIDARNTCEKEIREQRGGLNDEDKSHRARIYKKEINVLTEDHIKKLVDAVHTKTMEQDFSKPVTKAELSENDFRLTPSLYIEYKAEQPEHRPFEDIVKDLRRINREKNKIKLTINETMARNFNLDTTREMLNEANELIDQNNANMKLLGIDLNLKHEEYLTLTKHKVLKIENIDKGSISSIFSVMIPALVSHIHYLNDEDSRLLKELRDSLLPELMSGRIRVPMDGESDEQEA
ncbi:N-6 DNA methylase [Sporolactobacillus terrae]|uniref:N-6 DNA methylase n=1 Tax=Sporolactobacillus terrae TaxID=269673 RepID=UPI001CBFFF6C|nr:N-6 DNA methylase [Sporolactobacillus terrae]UAK17572.1 SAM-dependent methyltransferase [Sporolactobacillus terrae]